MSGIITIKEGQKDVKKIRVPANLGTENSGFGKVLIFVFWLTVLASGLYLLSDLTNNFSDLKNIIGHLGA